MPEFLKKKKKNSFNCKMLLGDFTREMDEKLSNFSQCRETIYDTLRPALEFRYSHLDFRGDSRFSHPDTTENRLTLPNFKLFHTWYVKLS